MLFARRQVFYFFEFGDFSLISILPSLRHKMFWTLAIVKVVVKKNKKNMQLISIQVYMYRWNTLVSTKKEFFGLECFRHCLSES